MPLSKARSTQLRCYFSGAFTLPLNFCKPARVTLVGYENTDLGRITVLIRGNVGEVNMAVNAGLAAVEQVNGGEALGNHVIPRPHENLEYVLPIYRSVNVEQFDADIRFPPPLSA
ncbi:BMC domain-containing protein [Halotia wernerae UHCC 0503]|nr:BMC domain-containing protein [Halotia wernerae UHCC 0503]